jgi:hypothetical protein
MSRNSERFTTYSLSNVVEADSLTSDSRMGQAIRDSFGLGGAFSVKVFFRALVENPYMSCEDWGFTEDEFDNELDRMESIANDLGAEYIEIN